MTSLSPRERQILTLVAEGRTSKEIAAQLRISVSTVNWHLSNVFGKLGASSRAEAVALALRTREVREVGRVTTSRPPQGRPAWHGAVAAVALVILGGAIVAGLDSASTIPATVPPGPAGTAGPPAGPSSPARTPLLAPATSTALPQMTEPPAGSPPPAVTAPPAPIGQPVASVQPLPAVPAPLPTPGSTGPLSTVAPLPFASLVPLPTVSPLPALPLPTASPLPAPPPPTASPLPALPLPTLGLP